MLLENILHYERFEFIAAKVELIKLGVGIGVTGLLIFILFFVAFYLAPWKVDSEKHSPYECGFAPFYDARINVTIHYYMVSLIFILFDIELLFIIPWCVSVNLFTLFEIFNFFIFLILLVIGLIIEWSVSALEWRRI